MRAHLIAARYLRRVTVHWDDEVDAIIAGDAAAGLASVTPARGVVVVPMAPLGLRDRDAGTVTVTSSLGLPKKLDRIRRNPSVALAYHAREHGDSDSPLYLLVQGAATVQERPNRAWLESITPQWEHFLGPRHGGTVGRLMDIYYWQRLAITVQVRGSSSTTAQQHRESSARTFPTTPRQPNAPRSSAHTPGSTPPRSRPGVHRLPHTLLGWVHTDGLPMVARVRSTGVSEPGLSLVTSDGPLPPGGRRAGLTAHAFHQHMVGQEQRVHTGWLEVDGTEATYAPHTKSGHALPRSQTLMTLGSVVGMRPGYRKARQLGLTP